MIEITYPTPSIVMVGGVPGSGKSTFLRKAAPAYAEIISADDVRGEVQEAHGFAFEDFRKELISEAREVFFADLAEAIRAGSNIFLDAAYLSAYSRKEITEFTQAQEKGKPYQHHLIMLSATYEQCRDGMSGRERVVPEDDLQHYFRQYEQFRVSREFGMPEPGMDTIITLSREESELVGCVGFS